jgi:hypothetical protein
MKISFASGALPLLAGALLAAADAGAAGLPAPAAGGERGGVPSARAVALGSTVARPRAAATAVPPPAAGQAGPLVDAVIAVILGGASHDAADAAFSTDNVDFAIRKGYVTTIGRVPPGIDNITGELGSTRCDTQVRGDGTITGAKACAEDRR